MADDTWDWNAFASLYYPEGGSGLSVFEPERYDPIIVNETEAGIPDSSPQFSHGLWIIRFEIGLIRPAAYKYMVDFHNSHRGGVPFYFYWPFELADIPDPPGAIPGGLSPWNSEIDMEAGKGPTIMVKWLQDKLPVRRHATKNNYWTTIQAIEFRQV